MRLRALAAPAAALLLSACAAPEPAQPPAAAAAPKPVANFEVSFQEVVASLSNDNYSRFDVYADGALLAQTEPGPKSQEKRAEGVLSPGNRLIRCERWTLPGAGEWVKDERPWERFVRVENGRLTRLTIKYSNEGRDSSFEISKVAY